MNKKINAFIHGYGNALNITGGINKRPETGYEHAVKKACDISQKAGQRLGDTFWKSLDEYERK